MSDKSDKKYAMEYRELRMILQTDFDAEYKLSLIENMIQRVKDDSDLSPAAQFQFLKNLRRYHLVIEFKKYHK